MSSLTAIISVIVVDFTENLDDPAPSVADTTGEFVINAPDARDNQFVLITHEAGESVAVEDIEIVVRVDGSDEDDFPREARLVDYPDPDENDPDNIIDSTESDIGFDTWSAGQTIEFRINTGGADFRIDGGPEADELEVYVIELNSFRTYIQSVGVPVLYTRPVFSMPFMSIPNHFNKLTVTESKE